jgi:hypothetical protein
MLAEIILYLFVSLGILALVACGYTQLFKKGHLVGILYFVLAIVVMWAMINVRLEIKRLQVVSPEATISSHT